MKSLIQKFIDRRDFWLKQHDINYGKAIKRGDEKWVDKSIEATNNARRLNRAIKYLKNKTK